MPIFETRRAFLTQASGLAAAIACPAIISARTLAEEAYPSKELSWIVHQSPGGLIDNTTRVLQPHLQTYGFKSTIEYVRGASGRIARAKVFRAKPDGYSIMTDTIPDGAIGQLVYNGQYKMAEYQPIAGWYFNTFALIATKTSPFKTLDDFIKAAKTRRVTMATIGKGNAGHLQAAILKNLLKLNIQFVHFDGGAPAFAAVVGGHVEVGITGSVGAVGDVVNSIAVFNETREPLLPHVPTLKELGHSIPFVNQIVYANAGPGIPADRVAKLREAFTKALTDPTNIEQQKKVNVTIKLIPAAEMQKISETAYAVVDEYKSELAE